MADVVKRMYSGFRGVDFREDEINLSRSPDALNVWRDYKKAEGIGTRPSLEKIEEFPDTVYGIYFYNIDGTERMLVHNGRALDVIADGSRSTVFYDMGARSHGFIQNNMLYLLDGRRYLQYDGTTLSQIDGYIPTTSIGRKPEGGGTVHEDVNLLSQKRINTFVADGESTEYHLDAMSIFSVDAVYINNVLLPENVVSEDGHELLYRNYTVDLEAGKVVFRAAPSAPLTDGQDNVKILFSKDQFVGDKISKCRLAQVFDNRIFFAGNPAYPNTIWHSSLDNPAYCSDLDYYVEGLDGARVTGLVAGNNALWVFREPSQANTTIFYHVPTIDSDYGKIYPSTHSNVSTGCIGGAINFNDDIVFFSDRGMEGIAGEVTTEQVLAHRSSTVDKRLTAEAGYKDMLLAEWEGYLFVFMGDKAYLADSRSRFTNGDHLEYDWFYWELGITVTCATTHNGILYLGTDDGIYTLSGEANVESYWVTPKDKFKNPNKQKTTNKRGCVVEASGDIAVYAKEEDTAFALVGEHKNVTDYFVSRIKKKKFKDLQLKFHSDTRFTLESVAIEAFIGGYIKR